MSQNCFIETNNGIENAMHHLVRLNVKTDNQNHRIIWTTFAPNGLPRNDVAAAYEIYSAYMQRNPSYNFHSDHYYDMDMLNIRDMAYAEEDEFGFEWTELEIKMRTTATHTLQIVSIEPISEQQAKDYRHLSDDHLDVIVK